MTANNIFKKDPNAVLDFTFDWTDWLSDGETISNYTITAEDGITKDSDSEADGIITVWLSSGTDGEKYSVLCRITTSQARIDDRTIFILITER